MAAGAPPPSGTPPPKIILAKPTSFNPSVPDPSSAAAIPGAGATVVLRSLAQGSSGGGTAGGSLNLLSPVVDSWEFRVDRALQFMTDNTDFKVIGVIGPTGVGKSTILNELYGYDGSTPGMLLPFPTQTDETRGLARHCTTGIEMRVSAERLILLDVQPIFSPSILVDMMKPDGSSAIPVLAGEPLTADLAHELMGIQVDLLKHGIRDPSSINAAYPQGLSTGIDKESTLSMRPASADFSASHIFVHTKLQDQEMSPSSRMLMKEALSQFFNSSLSNVSGCGDLAKLESDLSRTINNQAYGSDATGLDLFLLPIELQDTSEKAQFASFPSMIGKLRDQILAMKTHPFPNVLSEREWLRNSAKVWDLVKKSPVIADYCKTLQNSGLFRK